MKIDVNVTSLSGKKQQTFEISHLVIAGWAGRDKEAMEHHIQELEALGIKRPTQTPTFYRVAANRLTTDSAIECSGGTSSGEVETIIIAQDGKLYVGLSWTTPTARSRPMESRSPSRSATSRSHPRSGRSRKSRPIGIP